MPEEVLQPQRDSIRIYADSIAKNEQRPNQDAYFFIDSPYPAFGVFDGLGGHSQGDVASSLTQKTINDLFAELAAGLSLAEAQNAVRDALIKANTDVFQTAQDRGNDMATTA